MELNNELVTAPPRPAATVVMVRDGAAGLEVLLLRRHANSDVLGGAYVFPGGKIDAADAELDAAAHLDQAPAELHAQLGEPDTDERTAIGFYVAALREAFEESGVLLAHGVDPAALAEATAALRGGEGFNALLARRGLRLQTGQLAPWSRWITPRVPSVTNKRFDTRFFLTVVPAGLAVQHDDHEAVESLWLAPRAALERYWAGGLPLAPPQIMSLAHLSRHAAAASALAEARGRRPPVIQPEPFDMDGTRVIAYPGDERHPVRERALPGPSRLVYRQGRFEPLDGFEGLLR